GPVYFSPGPWPGASGTAEASRKAFCRDCRPSRRGAACTPRYSADAVTRPASAVMSLRASSSAQRGLVSGSSYDRPSRSAAADSSITAARLITSTLGMSSSARTSSWSSVAGLPPVFGALKESSTTSGTLPCATSSRAIGGRKWSPAPTRVAARTRRPGPVPPRPSERTSAERLAATLQAVIGLMGPAPRYSTVPVSGARGMWALWAPGSNENWRHLDQGGPISSETRINERIRVPEVRLVGPNGEQVGIVRIEDALRLAEEADLDLVEVAPQARPPVAKLMDFGKFKYESAQKARESRRNQQLTVIKEQKLRPKIDQHDYETKKGHVSRFLAQGNKVKVTIMF